MGGDPKADDAIREALEGVADRAGEKREALAALVVEGIDDGFRILEIRQQARWDYLQHCLGTPEGQEQLLGKFPDELGYVMDCLSEAEWLLCRKSQLWDEWWPRREDASVLMPYALRQAEPGEDDRDPFQLSNEPTTKGLAALRLAIIHDSVYVDDSILTMAINQEEDWPVRRELMVLHGVYCREDADLRRLFPVDANPRRIKARLEKWEAMVFGRLIESGPADGAGGDTAPSKSMKTRATKPDSDGDKTTLIKAALLEHHGYAEHLRTGEPLNDQPIGVRELERQLTDAGVKRTAISRFFNDQFGNHAQYVVACRREKSEGTLLASLKFYDGAFGPHILFGRTPPGERDLRDDD